MVSKNNALFLSLFIRVIMILFLFGVVTISACKKYLDKKSSTAITVPVTVEDLQGLLDDADLVMNKNLTPALGEASADDYFLLQSDYDRLPFQEQQFYIWKPVDYFFQNDWSRGYAPIYNANYCLGMIEKIKPDNTNSSKLMNVKGSALFYRAYNFLLLTWNYGKAFDKNASSTDLGISLRMSSDFNIPTTRASVQECYDQVIQDAKASIPLLPDISTHPYRPSKAAAFGLLARTYLSMRMYDSAFKYADMCLSLKNDLLNYNDLTVTASRPFAAFNKETIFYTEINIYMGAFLIGNIDTLLYDSYSLNDLRKTAFFRSSGDFYRFKGSYTGKSDFFSGLAVDEIYLIRSECNARLGNIQDAMADLNTLLENRWETSTFIPLSAISIQDALSIILAERRKELVFRGIRWCDIKRLNKENLGISLKREISNQSYQLQANANYFALPLPADIIEQATIPQNSL